MALISMRTSLNSDPVGEVAERLPLNALDFCRSGLVAAQALVRPLLNRNCPTPR